MRICVPPTAFEFGAVKLKLPDDAYPASAASVVLLGSEIGFWRSLKPLSKVP